MRAGDDLDDLARVRVISHLWGSDISCRRSGLAPGSMDPSAATSYSAPTFICIP